MQTSEQIDEIAGALAKAQAEIQPADLAGSNPAFKREGKNSKYATLASIWDACRAALGKNGIAVVQAPGTDDQGAVTMTTTLCHSSGQWMRSEMACKPAAGTAQQLGSVITYLRRYSLAAMTGVAPDDDDDGNQASGVVTPSGARAQTKQRPPADTPFDEVPPRQIETPKRSPDDFWKKTVLDLDPKREKTIEQFAVSMKAAIAAAPSEKALNKLIQDNDTRLDFLIEADRELGNEILEANKLRLGALMAG